MEKQVEWSLPVTTDEGWTKRLHRDKTVSLTPSDHPNSVRPDDAASLQGLECFQADLCRSLAGV